MQNYMNEGAGSFSDKEAKAAGFKSGAEMTAFYQNRRRNRGGSKIPSGTGGQTSEEARMEKAKPKKRATGGVWERITNALSGN